MANEVQFDRRTILTFAFGGPAAVTLAAGVFDDAVAAQGATRAPARTVRRVVTAHNAEGRSFIAVDDSVPMADVWRTQPENPIGTVPGDEKLLVGRVHRRNAVLPRRDSPVCRSEAERFRTGSDFIEPAASPTATSSTASSCSWSTRRRSASAPATSSWSGTPCTRGATRGPKR